MTDTHSSVCFNLNNPGLNDRDEFHSTWIICKIQREHSSYTSLCIFNDYGEEHIHAEVKFFDYWRNDPKKIFPDLASNDIDKKEFDLVWYAQRSPCDDCVNVVIENKAMYKSLTIKTASVYKCRSSELMKFTRNRITKLWLNGIKASRFLGLKNFKTRVKP